MKKKKMIIIILIFCCLFFVENVYAEDSCSGIFGTPNGGAPNDIADYMQIAFNAFKFVGIILCILLSVIDYFKAIVGDEKDMLKAITKKSLIRLIYVAVLFFLPSIIEFLLTLIGLYGSCGIS